MLRRLGYGGLRGLDLLLQDRDLGLRQSCALLQFRDCHFRAPNISLQSVDQRLLLH